MRVLTALLGVLVFGAMFSACSGGDSGEEVSPTAVPTQAPALEAPVPTQTAVPASPTAVAATAAPPTPTSAPQPQPTNRPPSQPTAAPPPASGGPVTLSISARVLQFDRTSITVPANTSITVNFTNNDMAVAHDFGVSIAGVPHTETCNGPCMRSINFNSGAPNTYTFQCSVHADMVGTFRVQ